jgi:hypothetical protein
MSATPVDFVFESKKFLVEVIYDSCVKLNFSVGSVKIDEIASATNDEELGEKYAKMLYGVSSADGFGKQEAETTKETTHEIYSSLCATLNNDNTMIKCTFFEMCVTIANIVFNVETIDGWCKRFYCVTKAYFGTQTSVICFLCDVIYSQAKNYSYFLSAKE